MKPLYFTGIGSRKVGGDGGAKIKEICDYLNSLNLPIKLRSGGANGSDSLFEQFIHAKDIYLPRDGFNHKYESKSDDVEYYVTTKKNDFNLRVRDKRLNAIKKFLPHWGAMEDYNKKFHFRNTFQILGHQEPEEKTLFVLFWAPEKPIGEIQGGTRTAVYLAQDLGIPTYNLNYVDMEFIKSGIKEILEDKNKELNNDIT